MSLIVLLSACSTGSTATSSPTPNEAVSTAFAGTLGPVARRYLETNDYPPACPTAAADAPVCTVSILAPSTPDGNGSYQASTTEDILFRAGWYDPERQSCDAFVNNTTTTFNVDGRMVEWVWLACRMVPVGGLPAIVAGQWFADMRYLSVPLAAGMHVVSAKIVYNKAVVGACANQPADTPDCTTPAGTVQTFKKFVAVS